MHSMLSGIGSLIPKGTCHVIEINHEPTPLTNEVSDFLIQGSAGEILSCIIDKAKEKRQ
jgi:NAD-dependent SIR2 family protein deacetylase